MVARIRRFVDHHVRSMLPLALFGALLLIPPPAASQTLTTPELPRVTLDTALVSPSGRTLSVPAGGDLQAALNAAQPGDVIEIQAGATFTGNFTLPNKSGSGWIYVRSSAHASLPPPGSRVSPADAKFMARIVSPNTAPTIATAPGAHHYRFIGLEITTTHAVTTTTNFGLINLGAGGGQTSLSQVPTDIIIDRCYIHGTPTGNVRRGIGLNSARTAVIDSYLSDFHEVGADSQALLGWNGPGPFKIVNNHLEGAGENVLFGGVDPSITNLVPSDIEVRGNHFFKPLTWRIGDPSYKGIAWSVKNLFELKNARRVLVDGNIFENNWLHSQNGFAILFTVRNQDGTAPWSVVEDVTFTRNIVRHTGSGVNVLGRDNNFPSQQAKRILIKNNVFDDVDGAIWGGTGRLFQLLEGSADVIINHNTGFQSKEIIYASSPAHTGFVYINNLTPHNQFGVAGDGAFGNPLLALSTYLPGALFVKNVLVGGDPLKYPAGNFFPATFAEVGFVDLNGDDFRLAGTSPYKLAGTDGKDIGADLEALNAATAGVISGVSTPGDATNPTPPPPTTVTTDTTPPAISAVSALGVTSSGVTIAWTTNEASDSQVEYGLTNPEFGSSTPLAASLITSHAQDLSGLAPGTVYYYRVKSRDAAGNLSISSGFTFTTLADTTTTPSNTTPPLVSTTEPVADGSDSTDTTASSGSTPIGNTGMTTQNVFWGDLVNVTATGNSLKKTSGCDGCQDAGAVSLQTISAGDGYLEFTASETTTYRRIGLSHGNTDTKGADIDFALHLWPGGVDVRENGLYKADTTFASGDVFRIAVESGVVKYSKNGAVFYTSTLAPTYPLLVDTSLWNLNATLTNVVLATASTGQSPYSGTPHPVPGRIEAEAFDQGGQGVAYHDATSGNQGGLFRTDVDVDIISPYAGGYAVNNFQTGEWLEYTIDVAQSGTYRIEALASSELSTSRFHVEIDGVDKTGSIPVPSTGSWRTFEWIGKGGVHLTAGEHVLRIYVDQEYFNLDAIRITSENVVWTNLVNVTATGNSLQKTSGCDGCQDAGAVSVQTIPAGDGYLEFTASETTTYRRIGLSHGNTDTKGADIDFGLHLWPGGVDVRENGRYKTDTTFASGDVFRIAVESGVVKYSKNGTVFYTSTLAPTYPLLVDTSLWNRNATLTNVVLTATNVVVLAALP